MISKLPNSLFVFLWRMIQPYRFYYAVMLSVPILTGFYDFANQYALKLLIDAFSEPTIPSYRILMWPIGIFITAQILLDVIWRIGDIAEWRSEPYVRREILLKTYDCVQNHDYSFFQETRSGSITSKIKGMLDGYDHFWASLHHEFTPKIANVVILTIMLSIVNKTVFLFMSIWGISCTLIIFLLSKKLGRLSFEYSSIRHHILGLIADNITNILTLFSFGTRPKELGRLKKQIEQDFIPSNIRMYKYSFFVQIIGGILYWVMLIGLFLFMIQQRRIGAVSTGDLVFVMGISLKIAVELWQANMKLQDFMKDLGDFKSSYNMLLIPQNQSVFLEKKLQVFQVKKPSIRIRDLHFEYETGKPVFSDLTVTIKAGEKVGIVGASGAGKSTLVALLLKYFTAQSGVIEISNQNIQACAADSIRKNIAVIPQDILLFHRTILENIRYGRLSATDLEVIEAAKRANIHDFIMTLPEQYQTEVGERGIKLSGGQRQRIAIARAILKDAPILILDEATSSLDTETEQQIQRSLNTFLDQKNTTVIAIAHRLSTLKHLDRIIVLERGQIQEEGTHEFLMARKNSRYRALWDMQQI